MELDNRDGVARDAPATVIATRELTWRVGGFTIVRDVSLEVRQGEFLSVIGPNGAGKSTLVNLLSGTVAPSSGRIELKGADVTEVPAFERVRRGLGRTFQTSSLFPGLTVLDNVRLAVAGPRGSLKFWGRAARDVAEADRAMVVLEEVRLARRAGDLVADLPHGDKRKLEIALVLATNADVLLLDEPTAGVSAEEVDELVNVVVEVHRAGRTVVMVEHHMHLVTTLSDRIAVMHLGELLVVDTPQLVMANETVKTAYLGGALS